MAEARGTEHAEEAESLKELPSLSKWPVMGHLPTLTRLGMIEFARRSWETHGDIFQVSFGPKRGVILVHPEHVKRLYLTHREKYGKRASYDGIRLLVGDGLVTTEGKPWKQQRRIIQPSFHRKSLTLMVDKMVAATADTVERWQTEFEEGALFDVYPEMMRLTLRIIGETLFSLDLSKSMDRSLEAFATALEQLSHRGNSLVQLPISWPTPGNRKLRKALTTLNDIVYRIIDQRRKAAEQPDDLLTMLLQAHGNGEDPETRRLIRDEVVTMFFAGHETTAIGLTWTWMLLSQHPEKRERMEAEIDRVLGDRAPSFDDLAQMPYTKAVFQEALRLYPPVVLGGRDVVEDDEIDGYAIKKGDSALVCTYYIHRHPDFWEQPEEFEPERFLPENSKDRHKFAYHPFSAGPRMCIGNNFSLTEGQIILAMLSQRFRQDLKPGFIPELDYQITLRPKHGLLVKLSHRPK